MYVIGINVILHTHTHFLIFADFFQKSHAQAHTHYSYLDEPLIQESRNDEVITGQVRLIRTRLIRCATLFEVSMKCFPIILLLFHA